MRTWRSVNWFRLFVVVGFSFVTSLGISFADEDLTRPEIFNVFVQAAIVGFAFLQCPEDSANSLRNPRTRRGENNG